MAVVDPTVDIMLSLNFFLGSEIYQETLAKALAKYFGARLLIVDSLLLPGVSFFNVYILIPIAVEGLIALFSFKNSITF